MNAQQLYQHIFAKGTDVRIARPHIVGVVGGVVRDIILC